MTRTRRIVQFGFLAVTIVGVFVLKGNAERWCPFGGVEAVYNYATQGNMLCSLGVSNFYILAAVLLLALLVRRAFCGYMCPIGTITEWLGAGAARLGFKPRVVPPKVDRVLAKLKYVVLAIILYFTWTMAELEFRVADPCYALISRHGEDITFWAYVVSGAILIGALFVKIPFCRWLCPLAAVFHPFTRLGFTRVKRDEEFCTGCGLCSKVCPVAIPVAVVDQVTHARCLSCLSCVEVCPKFDKGALSWGPPRRFGGHWPQGVVVGTVLFLVVAAVAAAYVFPIAAFVQERGEAPAETASVELGVEGLTCRGSAALFVYYLERDDEYALPGYLKIEAWPGPGYAPSRVTYDPAQTDESAIKDAIVEPYYDSVAHVWRPSPFTVEGYDPLGELNADADGAPADSGQAP